MKRRTAGSSFARPSASFPVARALVAGLCLALSACGASPAADESQGADKGEAGAATATNTTTSPPTSKRPIPNDAAAFLARLAPVPEGAVRIRYTLRGPGGSEGELDVVMRSGLQRAERWSLRMPKPGAESLTVGGASTMTPAHMWAGERGAPGERYPLPFEAIAERYVQADAAQRAGWIAQIDAWHAALAGARRDAPGDRDEVAGISCLKMQMAGQDLCLWEETGLPLRHRGAAFELEAQRVEVGAALSDADFEAPPAAAQAKTVAAPATPVNAENFFELLERQDSAALSLVLTPGLRLPDPSTLEPGAPTSP